MEPSQFTSEAPGRLVAVAKAGWAYIPDPLPPDIELDRSTLRLQSTADQMMGDLRGSIRQLPNPGLLANPFIRREAVLSSRIEGTVTSFDQLVLFEADPRDRSAAPDTQEVLNYVTALQHGLDRLGDIAPCHRLIWELHEELLRGVRGGEHGLGEYRRVQNYIAGSGRQPSEARFVPPPPGEVQTLMNDLEAYINRPSGGWPRLIELALIHYQFETIHPFTDGNGRVGRLLMPILLRHWGMLDVPVMSLSAQFERARSGYVDSLYAVSARGDWKGWVDFFLRAVIAESREGAERAQRLVDLRERYRDAVLGLTRSSIAQQLVDDVFELPVVLSRRVANKYKVTSQTARTVIQTLVDAGILREIGNRKRNRVYFAAEVSRIINAPPAQDIYSVVDGDTVEPARGGGGSPPWT